MTNNKSLIAAAVCCFAASFAHLVCIIWGPDGYRFFGAGEQMATMAEQQLWYPTFVTLAISVILLIWGLFALSGAQCIRLQLPFTRFALIAISSVFLLRGVGFVALMPMFPENSLQFWLISSGICLLIGGLFAFGTLQVWPRKYASTPKEHNHENRTL